MNMKYVGAIVGFVLGSVGYTLSKFWIIPIVKYKRIRGRALKLTSRVESSIASGGDQNDWVDEIRQIGVALSDRHNRLHPAYRLMLKNRGVRVVDACAHLSKLSNTRNVDHAKKHIEQIRQYLDA